MAESKLTKLVVCNLCLIQTAKIAKYQKSFEEHELAIMRANDKAKSLEERNFEMREGYERIQLEYCHLLDKKEK